MCSPVFQHNDPDDYLDHKVILHDSTADRILYQDGVLSFRFADGFWIAPNHEASDLQEVVRTGAAQVDFGVKDLDDISVDVHTRNIFRKMFVEYWDVRALLDAVNSGRCTIEFI